MLTVIDGLVILFSRRAWTMKLCCGNLKWRSKSPGEGTIDILQKYPVPECDIWFIKFSCDFHYNVVAIGNREGKIFVWEPQSSPPVLIARLSHAQSKSAIRQTAMSFDGSTILSCCEDGTIWRWDAMTT